MKLPSVPVHCPSLIQKVPTPVFLQNPLRRYADLKRREGRGAKEEQWLKQGLSAVRSGSFQGERFALVAEPLIKEDSCNLKLNSHELGFLQGVGFQG